MARQLQLKRANKTNAELTTRDIQLYCKLSREDELFLHSAIEKFGLSMRAYHRLLKVGRTIADLGGSKTVNRSHVAEALTYRALDNLFHQLTH